MLKRISRPLSRSRSLSRSLALLGGLTACALTACGLTPDENARLRICHNVSGVANIEVWLDGEFKLDLTPRELSQDLSLPAGDHALSLRFTGSAEELLAEEITLNERVNLLVLNGEGRDLSLTALNRPLPELELADHALEVINLTGDISYSLTLSKQTPPPGEQCDDGAARCPRAVLSLPLTPAEGDAETSEFITVTPGNNINITTDYLPRGPSDSAYSDLLSGETSIVLIRAEGGAEERPVLRLQVIRALF